MDRGLWSTALIGFLTPVVLLAPFSPAKAGFLDWLFGRREPAAVVAPHPDITVTPRKTARRPAPKPVDPKDVLAATIDPVKNPDWWLIDPTLRKGDILFLKDRVVVFVGARPGDVANYIPISQTRLVSSKERGQLLSMAKGRVVAKTRLADKPKHRTRRDRFAAAR